MKGLVYCIENLENGKKYIGQTTRDLVERFREHCGNSGTSVSPKLKNAIKKYGKDCFCIEVIWESNECTQDRLDAKEIELIEEIGTLHPNGYNLSRGGAGGRHSDETKKLLSEKSKLMWVTKREEMHRALMERNANRWRVFCFDSRKQLVKTISSVRKVAIEFGINIKCVNSALQTQEICNGYYFSRHPSPF